MYEKEARVTPPEDPNVKIWRYMDFAKFVAMLEDKALYFSRVDKLGDPFEGALMPSTIEERSDRYRAWQESGMPDEIIKRKREEEYEFTQVNRSWTIVNCWHMNEDESYAMWKIYGKLDEGIAVQSTYARLRKCLDEEIRISIVRYVNYETGFESDPNGFFASLHKRSQFSYERELRAIFWDFKGMTEGVNIDLNRDRLFRFRPPSYEGRLIKVELSELIENIYVAPTAPAWFTNLVKKISVKHGFDESVIHQSSLDSSPPNFAI
jgi:hypothetical protein